jgi:Cu(I)/Ag(I) efflux system membrane fusion protein
MNNSILIFLMVILILMPFYSCSKKEDNRHSHDHEMEETKEDKVLYWTCGMHLSVKVTKEAYEKGSTQCPICHMDLIPVYEKKASEGETSAPPVVISPVEQALIGVKTEKVIDRNLTKKIITVGRIAYDPELTVAEEEYLAALNTYEKILEGHIDESTDRAKKLAEQAEYRLRLLGLGRELIDELRQTKKVHTNLILPEDTVWVYADIYESELGQVRTGQKVKVEVTAYPGEIFTSRIRSIDPIVNPRTRSVRIRAEIGNPGLKLKPEMYANVRIDIPLGKVLSIPLDSVLDTGLRKVAWVDSGNGKYVSKEIVTGFAGEYTGHHLYREGKYIEVKKGLKQGELVVTRANFLIDSQSQLSGPAEAVYGGSMIKESDYDK